VSYAPKSHIYSIILHKYRIVISAKIHFAVLRRLCLY